MSTTSPPSVDTPDGPSLAVQMRPALVKYFKRKTGSSVEAEDLAQEVIVRALTHVDWKLAQAKGYIFRIAVNLWRDRRRRLHAQGVTVDWDEATAAAAGRTSAAARWKSVKRSVCTVARRGSAVCLRERRRRSAPVSIWKFVRRSIRFEPTVAPIRFQKQ